MLTVGELKQFIYCPRIFYFMAIPALRPPATHLMQRGRQLQEEFERLEPRRVLSRYGLEEAHRHFSISLSDPELDIAGQLDLLLEASDKLAVVDFKASAAAMGENHRFQLAAYALLAEKSFRKLCPTGFVVFMDRNEIEELTLSEELRQAVSEVLGQMRTLIRTQEFPSPTPVRTRCVDCEFRNFCGDIF
jgi:CRISPR-associated exonuclease Cas4